MLKTVSILLVGILIGAAGTGAYSYHMFVKSFNSFALLAIMQSDELVRESISKNPPESTLWVLEKKVDLINFLTNETRNFNDDLVCAYSLIGELESDPKYKKIAYETAMKYAKQSNSFTEINSKEKLQTFIRKLYPSLEKI